MPVEISTLALGQRFAPCEEIKMCEAVTARCQELSHMRVTLNIRRINSADVINAAVEDERKGKSNWSRKGKHKLTLYICAFLRILSFSKSPKKIAFWSIARTRWKDLGCG